MISSAGLADLQERYAWLRWARRWGLSIASLASGVLTLSLFRKGFDYLPWIIGYLLLLWLAGVVFAHARDALEARGRRLARAAYDYTLQSLYWHLLLFLVPIYYASATLVSRNGVFFAVLVGVTLLSAIDPWYHTAVGPYPWAVKLLFGFVLFATLKVALPLVRVPTSWALVLAAMAGLLALAPAVRRSFGLPWQMAGLACGAAAVLAGLLVWMARAWVPPAPLALVRGTFAREVQGLEPVAPVTSVSVAEVQGWGGVMCFTAVAAPAGLREPVSHVWRKNGRVVARRSLPPVRGGRPGGYRTFSRLMDLGPDPAGAWRVDVLTADGQLIGRVHLTVSAP
ncbi:MAG TPA: DUF5924 family protein [Candidatus Methylomirabilis sp.]